MNKITALVPMKGHSERVPNKNLKLFSSSPLYHKIVKTLVKCKYIDEIIVNTDSKMIIDDIKTNFKNITIKKRKKELQGDFVSMNKIIESDILNHKSEIFIQTHSTNPLLNSNTIDKALKMFTEEKKNSFKNFDSMFSVTELQSRFYCSHFQPINHNINELIRTQDLEPIFEENSCFYIFTKDSFFNNKKRRIGKKPHLYKLNKFESIDIDNFEDFFLAEQIYKLKKNKIELQKK